MDKQKKPKEGVFTLRDNRLFLIINVLLPEKEFDLWQDFIIPLKDQLKLKEKSKLEDLLKEKIVFLKEVRPSGNGDLRRTLRELGVRDEALGIWTEDEKGYWFGKGMPVLDII